ncbi:MAG: hypothetical protein Q8O29_16905, partial [Polaromonas sp.]|uniref:hypothetical protein n=1 Tax=Polaromonas sp. TaxID=1869339 RepID=UPI0027353664
MIRNPCDAGREKGWRDMDCGSSPGWQLGAWAAEGVAAKSGPGEDSFCRVCSLIAVAMGQKAGEKWTVAAALQPTFLLPP